MLSRPVGDSHRMRLRIRGSLIGTSVIWLVITGSRCWGAQQAAMGLLLAPKSPPHSEEDWEQCSFPSEFTFYNRL